MCFFFYYSRINNNLKSGTILKRYVCLSQTSVEKRGSELFSPGAYKSSHRDLIDKWAFSHVSTAGRERKTKTRRTVPTGGRIINHGSSRHQHEVRVTGLSLIRFASVVVASRLETKHDSFTYTSQHVRCRRTSYIAQRAEKNRLVKSSKIIVFFSNQLFHPLPW